MPVAALPREALVLRVPDAALPRLIEWLNAGASSESTEGEGEVILANPAIGVPATKRTVRVRYRLSSGFAEVRLMDESGGAVVSDVFAAGPVEQLFGALGFRPVAQTPALRWTFWLGRRQLELVHRAAGGWTCELAGEPTDALVRTLVTRFGLSSQ